MPAIKKYIELLKNIIHKIMFRINLKQMNDWWYYTGGNCWKLLPPSFYYTHTVEEVECITKETKSRIQVLIDQLGE